MNDKDTVYRQAAIDEVVAWLKDRMDNKKNGKPLTDRIRDLPSAKPDKEKISNALYRIYLNVSPHTSADGVVAIKYHIAEIWREIYGEEGPRWTTLYTGRMQ